MLQFMALGTTEIVLIVVVVVLLFGGKKIPELMNENGPKWWQSKMRQNMQNCF